MAIQPSVNHPIDCGLATTASFARQFAKQTVDNRSIDVFAIPSMRGIDTPTGTTTEIIGDINWEKETFPVSVSDCEVSIVGRGFPWEVKSVKSLNTGILSNPTLEEPLKLSYQSTGTTSVEVELSNGERHVDGFSTYTASSAPIYTFLNHLEGSLANHISDQVFAIANGSTSSPNHYLIYSTFNQTNNTYVKNSGCWAASLNFSGVSVNKVGSGGVTSVTMVTPRHAIGAAHYAPTVGDKMYFCDASNTTVERTITSVRIAAGDSVVVKFDSDVPTSVKKYKLPPSDWKSYLPNDRPTITLPFSGLVLNYAALKIPMIVLSHYRWDDNWPLQRFGRFVYIYESYIQWAVTPSAEIRKAFLDGVPAVAQYFDGAFVDYNGEPSGIRGGDSGLPCFYLVNGDLIYGLKHLYPATGPFLGDYLTELQDAIDFTGSEGYSIQTVDLLGFTDFSS